VEAANGPTGVVRRAGEGDGEVRQGLLRDPSEQDGKEDGGRTAFLDGEYDPDERDS